MFDIQPGGSTALPSVGNNVDESNVAHNKKTSHPAHPVTASLKNSMCWEVDSVVTAKKRVKQGTNTSSANLPRLAVAAARGNTRDRLVRTISLKRAEVGYQHKFRNL
jgi:hypothetical protein